MTFHRIGRNGTRYWGKAGAGILFTNGHKVLLLRRAESDHPGTWGLPGGKLEEGETAIDAAIRETKEECGLQQIPGRRIEDLPQEDGRFRWTTFLFRVETLFHPKHLSHEHDDWSWLNLEKLHEMNLHPKFREELARYLRIIRKRFPRGFSEWVKLQKILLENSKTC